MLKRAFRRVAGAGLAAAALALMASCDDAEICTSRCPSVAGDYAVQSNTLVDRCGFSPWLFFPTMTVEQVSGSGQVTLQVLDPVNQLPIQLVADLYRSVDAGSEEVALLRGYLRSIRQASWAQGDMVDLQVTFSGSITESDGFRWLQLTFQTSPVYQASCTTTQVVLARGAPL